jgi:hypothetical protein
MKCLKALSVPTNVVYTKEDSSAAAFFNRFVNEKLWFREKHV